MPAVGETSASVIGKYTRPKPTSADGKILPSGSKLVFSLSAMDRAAP